MKSSFEQALIEVWRQAFVESSKVVKLGSQDYSVQRTPKRGLRQVDFVFDGNEIRGLEQNPDTKSRPRLTGWQSHWGEECATFIGDFAYLQ